MTFNKRTVLTLAASLLLGLFIVTVWYKKASAPGWSFSELVVKSKKDNVPQFNKSLYSTNDPSSLWFIVNKQRALDGNYVPANLRQPNTPVRSSGSSEMLLRDEAASALEKMISDASAQGINLMLVSGFRSYGLQQAVYNGNVSRQGQAEADKTSARPGHSEHQTGLAADVGSINRNCELDTCFGQTPEGLWLAAHAHEYGFVVRYPDNMQSVVGYTYEPWHLRYVGTELSNEVKKTGQVLEDFFGLPAAPSY